MHDLGVFPCNRSLWSGTRTLRFFQCAFAKWRRPRLRCSMGSGSIVSKRHAFRCDPGRIVRVKITGLCSASDRLGFVRSRNRSETMDRQVIYDWRHLWNFTLMRTRNFRVRNEVVERVAVTKSQKGKKACAERRVGECSQWKAHGQCSKRDSCCFSHDKLAQGDLCSGQRRKGRSSSPAPFAKVTDEGGEDSATTSGNKEESSSDKRSEIPCRYKIFQKKKNCLSCKTLTFSRVSKLQVWDQMHIWRWMPISTCWGTEKAQQKV